MIIEQRDMSFSLELSEHRSCQLSSHIATHLRRRIDIFAPIIQPNPWVRDIFQSRPQGPAISCPSLTNPGDPCKVSCTSWMSSLVNSGFPKASYSHGASIGLYTSSAALWFWSSSALLFVASLPINRSPRILTRPGA